MSKGSGVELFYSYNTYMSICIPLFAYTLTLHKVLYVAAEGLTE